MADLRQGVKINFKSDFGWNINTCWKDCWATTVRRGREQDVEVLPEEVMVSCVYVVELLGMVRASAWVG